MNKNRLEAFSDGVIAIIITIMVLTMKMPSEPTFDALKEVLPVFFSYIISYLYVGIYWNNHHHMIHTVKTVTGGILWANLHLLFWLSLVPFVTGWIGENNFAPVPMFVYGIVLLFCGLSYVILQKQIIKSQGENSILKKAIGKDFKGKSSFVLYFLAVISTFFHQYISIAIYILVAIMWLVPDRRIERIFS